MAAGGVKRKRISENFLPPKNLFLGFRAGEEVCATRALMVGDFGRKLSGENAADGVVVMFKTSVDCALTQVEFDDFIGREIQNLYARARLWKMLCGDGVEKRVNVVVGRSGGRLAGARLAEENRRAAPILYQLRVIRREIDERAGAFNRPSSMEKSPACARVMAHGTFQHQRGLLV